MRIRNELIREARRIKVLGVYGTRLDYDTALLQEVHACSFTDAPASSLEMNQTEHHRRRARGRSEESWKDAKFPCRLGFMLPFDTGKTAEGKSRA